MSYRQVYEIDDEGFKVDTIPVVFNTDGNPVEELGERFIVSEPPHGLIKARWTGVEWIEGATQEEIEDIVKPHPVEPTEMELLEEKVRLQEQVIEELMFDIIPNLMGGSL
ncbi:hypothetical protein H9649_07410 [Sporosarcina sp. Sa2YVA2]|uniref:Bacteriophage SP-beta YorD domain-containing protein n=1 Tax=Sporosarcina quadrami TaxID=2762234 RepID=A0ABR8U8N1_9BACL|nr:hypothetical protein [Sporosarcina quadrami]MBD7984401.1 hypothetical protein [Sporosarcina quadrami]